jgi:hypothetical protein
MYSSSQYRTSAPLSVEMAEANLEDMKKAIVMSSLPQTFQDAIRVTRELGQR